jgi:hypothetical protein
MRVEKFDAKDTAALRALNFEIDDDGEVAKLDGVMRIEIIRLDATHFDLEIMLPDGTTLDVRYIRERLWVAGGTDDE